MHYFQPCPIELWEFNPFIQIGKDGVLVTTGTKTNPNTTTVGWGGVGVLWGKNVVFLFVRKSHYTKELIDKNGFFSVSFVDDNHKDALKYCGSHTGRDEDKIKNAGLTVGSKMGIPYIDESDILILCNKIAAVDITKDSFIAPDIDPKWYPNGDYHTMYVGEIMEILAR